MGGFPKRPEPARRPGKAFRRLLDSMMQGDSDNTNRQTDHGDAGFQPRGQVLAGISDSMVRLYREHFGKGPTGAKTYVLDDLVICVMRDGLTTVEKTLFEQGRGDAVREMRAAFQDAVSDRFTGVVEDLTGRKVLAFMSQAHVAPDLAIEVFFLDGAVAANGSHETEAADEEAAGGI